MSQALSVFNRNGLALTAATLAQFAPTTSAQLAGVLSDEAGSGGGIVRATSPSFTGTIGVGGATAAASGAGVSFPATQSASSDANTLDDYEEGTWTPVLRDASAGNAASATAVVGQYVKIGRLCFCHGQLVNINTTGLNAAGNVFITGLPFASANLGASWPGSVYIGSISTVEGVAVILQTTSTSYCRLYATSTTDSAFMLVSALTSGSADVVFSIFYEV